jgi:tetratricopeptide (TPR) repeat protein
VVEGRTRVVLGLSGLALLGLLAAMRPQSNEAAAAPGDEAVPVAVDVTDAKAASAAAVADEAPEPPYDPLAAEGPLRGLTGAATALAIKDYTRAIELSGKLPPEPAGSEKWFTVGALRGRALAHAGRHAEAVDELQSRWNQKGMAAQFPAELLGYELAKAKVALAKSGTLPAAEADAHLYAALDILQRVAKTEPIRNLAQVKVLQAEAMLAVQGGNKKATSAAARKAAGAIDKILVDYPHHPRTGEFWLERTRALVRQGKAKEAAEELRSISIHRAGEPEAEEAWAELEKLASTYKGVGAPPLSHAEKLSKALAARSLRHVDLSRELLDELVADPKTPGHIASQAKSSRAYTASKQRDYKPCVDDLLPAFQRTGNFDIRDRLLKCMEKGGMYEEALEIHDARTKDIKRKGMKSLSVWTSLQLAFRGGLYERAEKYLKEYEALSTGNRAERAWLHAWLPMRLGRVDEAIAGFEAAERYDRRRAQYFRGKLLVKSEDPAKKELGRQLLMRVIESGPIRYYGLEARNRLLEAGMKVPPMPKLTPMVGEATHPTRAETQKQWDDLDATFGAAWPPIRRGKQLYAAGWIEESRRELRVAEQAYRTRGKKAGGVRNESILVGLGWKGDWSYPRVGPTKEGRKQLRDGALREQLRAGLLEVARGVDEPSRVAHLSTSAYGSSKSRWHPRAYRAAVEREARHWKIDPIHMWSLMFTESRFQRHVVSPVGARGALQIMPWTATQLARRLGELDGGSWDTDTLFDIDTNAHLAGYYVAELLNKFHGQPQMAYASYNGGPSNVARWLAAKSKGPVPLERDVFVEEIAYRESYNYTRRVTEVFAAYSLLYRGELPQWSNEVDPDFEDNIDF